MLTLTASVIAVILYLAFPLLRQFASDKVINNPTVLLDSEDKEQLYQLLAADLPGIYEAVPDGEVGKLLQRKITKTQRGAIIVTNNAGFRDHRPYIEKSADTFRIVCLGDSFVEGTGGKVEDRFCNQIEDSINEHRLLGAGMAAQAYALGVGSWTAVNSATYMISHLSAYDPDLIIVLMVSNDIADGQGVSGIGTISNRFSPEYRAQGSAVFSASVANVFGESENFLLYDLGPESVARWDKAFSLYRRLEDLQRERGKKMLFSVLDSIELFSQQARKYHAKFGMTSPFLTTDFFPGQDTRLPHDSHPNREGHRIIANHYLHAMLQQGWIVDPDSSIAPLHQGLSLNTSAAADQGFLKKTRRDLVTDHIPEQIKFNDLGRKEIQSFLGGIWPDFALTIEQRRRQFPHGTTKTAFLLARAHEAKRVNVQIFLPPMPELFPTTIELFINGRPSDRQTFDSVDQYGEKTLSAKLTELDPETDILEVLLSSDTHWSTITDNTMRSYELRRAFQSSD